MKKLSLYAATGLLLLAAVEAMAYLALQFLPFSTPLAFASGEGRLHLFVPQKTGYYYGIKPDYRQVFRAHEFNTRIRTNNRGFRMDIDFDGGALDIAVVGDSFTFGHGVNVGERYADLIADGLPQQRLMTLSPANGAAPADYYLYLKNHRDLIPRVLIVGLFPWNDLSDDIASVKLVRDSSGELGRIERTDISVNRQGYLVSRSRAGQVEPWWQKRLRDFNAGRLLLIGGKELVRFVSRSFSPRSGPKTVATLSPFEQGILDADAIKSLRYLSALSTLVRARGGHTLVMYIPVSYMVGRYPWLCERHGRKSSAQCLALRSSTAPNRALMSWFGLRPEIEYVDLTQKFRLLEQSGQRQYFEIDAHWTKVGHANAARAVLDRLKSLGWLQAPD